MFCVVSVAQSLVFCVVHVAQSVVFCAVHVAQSLVFCVVRVAQSLVFCVVHGTICGRIMIGLSFLSSVSKHNMWLDSSI